MTDPKHADVDLPTDEGAAVDDDDLDPIRDTVEMSTDEINAALEERERTDAEKARADAAKKKAT